MFPGTYIRSLAEDIAENSAAEPRWNTCAGTNRPFNLDTAVDGRTCRTMTEQSFSHCLTIEDVVRRTTVTGEL